MCLLAWLTIISALQAALSETMGGDICSGAGCSDAVGSSAVSGDDASLLALHTKQVQLTQGDHRALEEAEPAVEITGLNAWEASVTKQLDEIKKNTDTTPGAGDYIGGAQDKVLSVVKTVQTCGSKPGDKNCGTLIAAEVMALAGALLIISQAAPPVGQCLAAVGALLGLLLSNNVNQNEPLLTITDIKRAVATELRKFQTEQVLIKMNAVSNRITDLIRQYSLEAHTEYTNPVMFKDYAHLFVDDVDSFENRVKTLFDDMDNAWSTAQHKRNKMKTSVVFSDTCTTLECPPAGTWGTFTEGYKPAIWDSKCPNAFQDTRDMLPDFIEILKIYRLVAQQMALLVGTVQPFLNSTLWEEKDQKQFETGKRKFAEFQNIYMRRLGARLASASAYEDQIRPNCYNYFYDRECKDMGKTKYNKAQDCAIGEVWTVGTSSSCDPYTCESQKLGNTPYNGFVTAWNFDNSADCNSAFGGAMRYLADANDKRGRQGLSSLPCFRAGYKQKSWSFSQMQGSLCGDRCVTGWKKVCTRPLACAPQKCRNLLEPKKWDLQGKDNVFELFIKEQEK